MAVWRSVTAVFSVLFVLVGCGTTGEPEPASTGGAPSMAGGPALLAPFLGVWEGTTTDESDRERTLAVLIEGGENDSFAVTWRNWEATDAADAAATGGDPVQIREIRLDFVPTEQEQVFAWVDNPAGDSEGSSAVARLSPGRLVVHVTALTEDGRRERQTYVRQLVGDEMVLDYTRWVDEEIRSVLQARLFQAFGG